MNKFQQILTKYWGYSQFRPLQTEIIQSIVDGNDTLALMTTGGGKSITFQVPALYNDGICIVITPLIALMKDQVEKLTSLNIKALYLHSGMYEQEIKIALDNCLYGGDYKFLYCSPERISSEIFKNRVQKMKVNLIAIDEAHCISQWGYDFRPSYLKIADLRNLIPNVPILALTATATPDVVNDIQEKLLFKKKNVIKAAFERKNLCYIVRETDDKEKYILERVNKFKRESGIIYVRSRKKAKEIAEFLLQNKVSADYFHAGMDVELRNQKQNAWKSGYIKVIVSTNAFGMGIDKSNVRYVIHYNIPDSLEEYFQEAGRAGRDDEKSYAVLLYNQSDINEFKKRGEIKFPEIEIIKNVYQAICNYFNIPLETGKGMVYDFKIAEIAENYNYSIITIYNSLMILQSNGYIELTDEINHPPRLHFIVGRDELYKFQISNAAFDSFIKLILRTYPGVFSDYVKIDERILAQRGNVKQDIVYQYLSKLNTLKIISYIPQKKTPFLIMTENRLDLKNITFSAENYRLKKEDYISRLSAILMYLTSNSKCRSQILLAYFGEKNTNRCGVCDVCLKRNELDLSKYEFDLIHKTLKESLSKESIEIETLLSELNYEKEKSLKVIQFLIDNNKIIYVDQNKLRWK